MPWNLPASPHGTDPAQAAIALAALLLLPLAMVLLLRGRALRAPAPDPAPVWFGYARTTSWIVGGWWLAWIAEVNLTGAAFRAAHLLPWRGPVPAVAVAVAVYLLPPAMITIAVAALSHRVAARLRGSGWTLRETVAQAAWQQAALIVPLACLGLAAGAAVAGSPRAGIVLAGAAVASRLVLLRLQLRAMGIAPHAVTAGPLRDRLFALTDQAGVRLQQLYVVPMARGRMANAFAVRGNLVVLTDYLLEHLSRREVDAVMAHEITHLKRRHPLLLLFTLVTVWVVLAQVIVFLGSWALASGLGLVVSLALFGLVSRRFEREADAGAVALTGDAEALITGLAHLTRVNTMPMHWGRWDESMLTHPSTRRRALAIGARAGLPRERIEALLRGARSGDDHYEMPSLAPDRSKVFSSLFKAFTSLRIAWILLGLCTLGPAALIATAGVLDLGARYRGPLDGVLFALTVALSFIAIDRLAAQPYPTLRKRLLQRHAGQGLDPERADAIFAGLAPDPRPRIYEGFFDWDVGFLFLGGDRLCYVGEETRFALRRDQVVEIAAGERPPGWIAVPRVIVRWEDAASGADGAFTLRPAGASTLVRAAAETPGLLERLREWQRGAAPRGGELAALAGLALPSTSQVTSISPRMLVRGRTFAPLIVITALAAAGACVLFGLPFSSGSVGFVDVLGLALLSQLVHRIPYWRWREEPPSERAAPAQRAA